MILMRSAAWSSSPSRAVSSVILQRAASACAMNLRLADLKLRQPGPESQIVPAHAPRQGAVEVPVSRRAITSLSTQYTRDSELAGWCSWSRTSRRCRLTAVGRPGPGPGRRVIPQQGERCLLRP